MAVYEHLSHYAGLPVADFDFETESEAPRPRAAARAWRVSTAFEEEAFTDTFERFLGAVDSTRVTALVIGYFGASYDDGSADPAALLAEAADRLPALRSLFIGDITGEESEISWIEQSDITPLFKAYPHLQRLEVRGSTDLRLEPFESTALRVLRFESGGLPAHIVQAVGASDLPNLEHLDLWLGTDRYGGDATIADFAPFLSGERFPKLRHLGLEDREGQDEIAAAVAGAPVVARLESLSLAMGDLTDEGAAVLLAGQPLTHLRELDLHHHFLTDAMAERVQAALPGVEVNLERGRSASHRDQPFLAVSE